MDQILYLLNIPTVLLSEKMISHLNVSNIVVNLDLVIFREGPGPGSVTLRPNSWT